MATPKVYVICDSNCKYEGMTKEQILAAIAQAIETGSVGDCDTGFITTIKTVTGAPLRFFVGTQAEYAALADKSNLFAIITDDTTKEGILAAIAELQTNYTELRESLISGALVVGKANRLSKEDSVYDTVDGYQGVLTNGEKLTPGATYIITARISNAKEPKAEITYEDLEITTAEEMISESYVSYTLLLYIPLGITDDDLIYSSATVNGIYCMYRQNTSFISRLRFFNSEGTEIDTYNVTIRKI